MRNNLIKIIDIRRVLCQISILIFLAIIISIVLVSRSSHDRNYPEVTWEVISYKEIPQEIRDIFESKSLAPNSNSVIGVGSES